MTKKIKDMLTVEQYHKYRTAYNKGYFRGYNENPRAWRHTFTGAYVWKYPLRVATLDIFTKLIGHAPQWEDITDANLRDLREELTLRYSANTIKNRLAEIRALISDFSTEVQIPSVSYKKLLQFKGEPSQAVYLNEEEIERIFQYTPISEAEAFVKKVFLVEAYTGARACDAVEIKLANCDRLSDTISYVSKKTKKEVRLPVHANLIPLLNQPCIRSAMPLDQFNSTLRRICRKVGINQETSRYRHGEQQADRPKWEFVSSHTGRRSFATNLFVRGADPATISQYMGHSSPDITVQRYIVGYRNVSEAAIRFFKP